MCLLLLCTSAPNLNKHTLIVCLLQLCTFAPKLNKHTLRGDWAGSALERSEAWQIRRNEKLHEMREQDADKDLRGCTFWYCCLLLMLFTQCAADAAHVVMLLMLFMW